MLQFKVLSNYIKIGTCEMNWVSVFIPLSTALLVWLEFPVPDIDEMIILQNLVHLWLWDVRLQSEAFKNIYRRNTALTSGSSIVPQRYPSFPIQLNFFWKFTRNCHEMIYRLWYKVLSHIRLKSGSSSNQWMNDVII